MLSFFPRGVLDEILNLIESVSEGFTSYSYAPTSGHDDSEVDHFYQQLQEIINKTPKKDILVIQGDWNAKVGKDTQADWEEVCGPYCNVETNERGIRLLDLQPLTT